MNTKAFTGAAGTGKTSSLLQDLTDLLARNPLRPGQSVLGLTFMHGARQRLSDRLVQSPARRSFDCQTIDRFAWETCRRWRSRLRADGGSAPLDLDSPDYDGTCEAAGRLLASGDVAQWLAVRYPCVIVDEFQDCAAVRLSLIKYLHGRVNLLIAADDFQNLGCADESPAVAWLRELGVAEELTACHRTSDADLIAAAQALRAGAPLVAGTHSSFKILSAPAPAVAASFVSQTMAPAAKDNVVLISAARPGTSKWVDEIVRLVGTRQYGKQKSGPVPIQWELSTNGLAEATCSDLGAIGGDQTVGATSILALPRGPVTNELKRWTEAQRRLLGRSEFGSAEISGQIQRIAQRVRSRGTVRGSHRAITIHQAKNREFPVVLVLWPFKVVGDPVLARRWLYNAITRASRRAIVIVEDPQKNRLGAPPFA